MIPDTKIDRFEWLERRVFQLEKENVELKKQVLKLHKENADLKRRLLAYENAHTPSSKSKRKRLPKDEPSGKLGASKGHEKYERKQPEPTSTVEHKQDSCSNCGEKLGKPFMTERRVTEDIPEPQPIEVTEHLIQHYRCNCCGKENTAPHSLPVGCFGYNLQTHVTLLKYDDRLPLRKVVNSLQRHYNIKLSDVAVLNITKRTAKALQPDFQNLVSLTRASKVVYVDETEIKVDGEKYWIWVFSGEHGTVYVIRKSRSRQVVHEILGKDYVGVVTSDGHSAYSKYKNRQRCWAHIIREAKQLLLDYPSFALFYKKLKRMYSQIKRIREKKPVLKKRLQLKQHLEQRMQELIDTLDSHRPFKDFATKLSNGSGQWFTCIVHLFVEPTNNIAERALRELIVQRKIIGGLRAQQGADTMSIVNTMLTTWKQQEKPLFQTLKTTITR